MTPGKLRIGLVIDGGDQFVRPIESALRERHTVERFAPRFIRAPVVGSSVNKVLLHLQFMSFLRRHDVVFFEWGGPLAAMASRRSCRTTKIVRIHRTEVFAGYLAEFRWSAIDKVILVSDAMRSRLERLFPEVADRTLAVHNGVDLTRFMPTTGTAFAWRIGMLGNLIPRKRVYDIVCALADLPKDVPWKMFVGGGPAESALDYWDALNALVDQLRVTDSVHLEGQISDAPRWFKKIDVFVSASYSEGHQVALIEAMACGCYCLSHCWAGAEEVLPPENIFTTDSDLRAKLLEYAARPESEKRQAQAQMRAIAEERFDQRRMVAEILEIIEGGA